MILGINGIRLVSNRSGVARAIEALLEQFGQLKHPFDDIRVYTPQPLSSDTKLPAMAKNVVVPSLLPPSLWEQISLPLAHPRRSVLFCPSYTLPLFATCPTMLAHHGSYEGYSGRREVFSRWRLLKARYGYQWSARRASIVSTVSEFSRRDMVKFYGMPAERIHVIPEGVDTALFRPLDDPQLMAVWRKRLFGEDLPFLLYVGKPTKRRNLPNLLRAFRELKRTRKLPHKLVLIGTALPGTSFTALTDELDIAADVISIPHAPHSEIALAYNACSIMLYPSSYEGFGMPVLEAMACGTPVIALNNTAFPEFAGGVAMLLPDAEVATLRDAIAGLLADKSRQVQMRLAGPERAAPYDWRYIAQRYLNLLIELIPEVAQKHPRSA